MSGLFGALLAALGVQRLVELAVSRRHERALLARGGERVLDDGMGLIVLVHALFFALALAEFALAPWAGWHALSPLALAVLLAGEALRYWAIGTLGERWSTRVVVLPGRPPVARGPYRWLRHPNYWGVALTLAAFPLAFGLPATALVVTALNALALARRVRVEERALASAAAAATTRPAARRGDDDARAAGATRPPGA